MNNQEHDYMFKTILIGSSGVGKSNILLRFTRNQFNQNHQTTVGVEFATKSMNVNGKIIKLQIWDTLGQEQYKSIMRTFYKGASAVILTYDITDLTTFSDLDYWTKQIKDYSKSEVIIMLVGNKSDLQQQRKISKQKGLQYAQKNKIAFYEVSAKDGTNVQLIFTKISEELYKIMEQSLKPKKNTQNEAPHIISPNIYQKQKQSKQKQQKNIKLKTEVQNKQLMSKKQSSCCK